MQFVNVLVIKENNVTSMDTFPVFEEQLSNEVVEQAEARFVNLLKEHGFITTDMDGDVVDDITNETLDNGLASNSDVTISIVWS